MTGRSRGRGSGLGWVALLLPSGVVVLFSLLQRWATGPTAGALAFLTMVAVACWLFPKSRVTFKRLLAAVVLALVVACVLALLARGEP